jgi:hypothetical protein
MTARDPVPPLARSPLEHERDDFDADFRLLGETICDILCAQPDESAIAAAISTFKKDHAND